MNVHRSSNTNPSQRTYNGCIGTSSCSAVDPQIGSSGELKGCETVTKITRDSIDGAASTFQSCEQGRVWLLMLSRTSHKAGKNESS